jgi:DNA-binding GntR family transcriptional regulator
VIATGSRSHEAAYQTLAQDIRAAILKGQFTDGRLPTEAELARSYGVSRQTVRRAFHDLVSEGMVTRVPGRGTFVAPRRPYLRQFGSVEDLMALSLDTTLEVVTPLRRRVDIEAASRLALGSDYVSQVVVRRRHDDTVFCVTTVSMPPAVGRLLADVPELGKRGGRSSATIIGLIDQRLPAPIASAEQSITAVAASGDVVDHLGCTPGEPLLRIDRLYRTADGEAVELAISHFLPEHYSYRVALQRSAR